MKHVSKPLAIAAAAVTLLGLVACGSAEQRKDRYLAKGEEFLAQNNFEKARLEFRNALQIDPKDAQAHFKAGRAAERLGDPQNAVAHYQAAVDNDADHAAARAALARLFLLGGATDRAYELAEKGLAQNPKDAQLLTVRAAVRGQRKDVVGAFEDAEAAVAAAPSDEYAVALLASLYRSNARSDKAIEVVQAGIAQLPNSVDLRTILAELHLAHEQPEAAEEQLKQVVALQPKELVHRYRLVRLYLMSKNVDAAERTLRDAIVAVPADVGAKLQLAQLLVSQRGFEAAEQEFKKFVAAEGEKGELKLALAGFYQSHGKADRAEPVYRELVQAFDLKPVGLTARTRLAGVLAQRQNLGEASTLLEAVLKENPRDYDALVLRGNLALARGDATAAITDLRAVLRDQPNASQVKRALARAHLQNNETALAEELLQASLQANPKDAGTRADLAEMFTKTGRPEHAQPLLEQLARDAPTDVGVREQLFRVQAGQKNLDAARQSAEEIVRLRPDLPLGYFLRGTIAEAHKDVDKAVADYERALQIQPDAAEPLAALIRIDVARQQPQRALNRLEQVIAQQPGNVIALNMKGELLTARGESASARASFEAAIAKAPQWWVPYRGLALTDLAEKKTDAAIATFERGLDATAMAPALATDLAALYERLKRVPDAIRVYEELVAKDPKSLAAANNLAMLLASYRTDQASLDRAAQLTSKLSNATDPAVLNTRGWVKYKRGEYSDAVVLLKQAADKSPESPIMRYHLGMAQLRAGDKNSAARNLAAAVASGRSFHGHDEARATLDQLTSTG